MPLSPTSWPSAGSGTTLSAVRAQGSSSSGTPGTTIIDTAVTAGNRYVDWTLLAAQANAANTNFNVIITYSDATTDSLATVAATASIIIGNPGQLQRYAAGLFTAGQVVAAKSVTRIQVQTAGVGVGQRDASFGALETLI